MNETASIMPVVPDKDYGPDYLVAVAANGAASAVAEPQKATPVANWNAKPAAPPGNPPPAPSGNGSAKNLDQWIDNIEQWVNKADDATARKSSDGITQTGKTVEQWMQERKFHPYLPAKHSGKSNTFMSRVGLNFETSTFFFSYYPVMRMLGAWREIFDLAGQWTEKRYNQFIAKARGFAGELEHDSSLRHYPKMSAPAEKAFSLLGADIQDYEEKFETALKAEPDKRHAAFTSVVDNLAATPPSANRASWLASILESTIFTGLALFHAVKGYRHLMQSTSLAVGAELGKLPKDVTFSDVLHSNNPLITTMTDRFIWQQMARHGAGLAPLINNKIGFIANALLIGAERTVFYGAVGSDVLWKAVNDVQLNNLGPEAKTDLVGRLMRTLQAERLDHRRELITHDEMQGLKPVLSLIAGDIIDRKFGYEGALYIMGSGILIPGAPQQSLRNYLEVREKGVRGIALDARQLRLMMDVPGSQIWDMDMNTHRRGTGYVAESARENELLRNRQLRLERGPAHATPGPEVDSPNRRESGVLIY